MNDDPVSAALNRSYKVGLRKPEKDEDYSIDFQHWLKFDTWTLKQAASILIGTNPNKCNMRKIYDETFSEIFRDTLQVIENAEGGSLAVVVASEPYGENKIKHGTVELKIFIQWASQRFEIPESLIHLLDKDESQLPKTDSATSPNITTSKKSQRVSGIVTLAEIWFDDLMSIPDSGKSNLKQTLCELNPSLYTAASFDEAWKDARKENRVKMKNHEQYSHSK